MQLALKEYGGNNKMNKNIILPFILISYFLSPTSTLAHGDAHDELIIRITNNGFEPKELTVTLGDEVLFINNDDVDHWPASNYHPTHTLYPEFDPLKGIPPGSSWKFTFNKVGTWRIHDHLFPHLAGSIMVKLDPDLPSSVSNQSDLSWWAKLKNFFLQLFKKSLVAKEAVSDDHARAHLEGQKLFKKYGLAGLSHCSTAFAFGCYHGLMEVALTGNTEEEYQTNLIEIEGSCHALGDDNSGSYASCIHGIGHGIATYRDHDLTYALKDCAILSEATRTYCHDGVFMEFSISAPPSFYKKENPIYPCDTVAEDYKTSCARSQVQVMRLRFGMETDAIAQTCMNTENSKIIYHCVDALGYFIAQTSRSKPSKIISECQDIKDEQRVAQCIAAAAGELVFQNYVGWQESVKEICSSLSGTYQSSCYKRVEQVRQSYGRN